MLRRAAMRETSRWGERTWLAAIVAGGVALRAYRLSWGLPDFAYPDGVMYFVRPGVQLVAAGEWVPGHFVHPPLLVYVTALVFAVWSLVTRRAIAAAGAPFYAELPTLTLLGRATSVVFSGGAIVAVYLVGRRLLGGRGALLAAAVFAFAPLQVLEAHRIQPDAPMLLTILLATLLAIVARERRRRALLVAAFAVAGISGGFKYTGPAVAAIPAWVALTWPDEWRQRIRWTALGGLVMLAGLALGCLPVFFDWHKAWSTAWAVIYYSYVIGMSGVDIKADGWTYVRYVYALVVALPYMVGWAAYLAALAGFAVLVRRRPASAGIVLAFVVPYFAIMGGATAIVARYYLPLAPYLALAAGAALDEAVAWRRGIGLAVVAVVLAYTAGVSVSQCRRLGLGPQREVAALVADRARDARPPERAVAVAYPHVLELYYDAVGPLVRTIPRVKMVYYPAPYQNVRHESVAVPPEDESLALERGWVRDQDVQVVLLPSWEEHAVLREHPHGANARFFAHLRDGVLGFHEAAEFHTRFWTQALYTWGDPMLDTHWETAITGYKVFVREQG